MDVVDYDFENDPKISDERKRVCRLEYDQMELRDLDKLFQSAFKYDKQTGDPIAKKPKSLHELVYLLHLGS